MLSSECPNCGRLRQGHSFDADPGPLQREVQELQEALSATQWVLRHVVNEDAGIRGDPLATDVLNYAFEQPRYTPDEQEVQRLRAAIAAAAPPPDE